MSTTPMPKTRRSALVFSLAVSAAFAAAAATAAPTSESFVVEKGTLVKGCGGVAGGCRDFTLRGALELTLDPATATAVITAETLELGRPGEGFSRLRPSQEAIVGTFAGDLIRFTTSPDVSGAVDWTFLRTAGGLVLQGSYDQGCCDLYAFDFRNVSFDARPGSVPPTRLLLGGGRFAVEVRFEDFAGDVGAGKAVEQGGDSGYFWFFDADNTEVVVKLIDACAGYDRFWFFAAGLTNVEVEITVTDLSTGSSRVYANPMGRKFETILDVDAFATCN
jgi:hypothetical protein